MITCSHHAYLCPVLGFYRISSPRNGLVLDFDTDKLALRTLSLLAYKDILSDKLFLVKLAEHAETCLDRSNGI